MERIRRIKSVYPQCVAALAWAAATLFLVAPGYTSDATLPTPSYAGSELAKVRQWEEDWAGKRIDGSNVDGVAQYLPEAYRSSMKNQELGAGQYVWFEIVPYRRVVPTRGFAEATAKNMGRVKMNEEMIPLDYEDISGLPFPEPKTGWEVAWNYDFNNRGDSLSFRREAFRVDPVTGLDRGFITRVQHLWFVSRTELSPRPRVPDEENLRKLRWVFLRDFEHPTKMAKDRVMNYRYLDFGKDDEDYRWISQLRRIRRTVASQKVGTGYNMERSKEDQEGFFNHVVANDYKLLGRKDLLAARHNNPDKWVRAPGQHLWSGIERERINTYVVEAVPKDPTHVYSKRVWYIDPEDFYIKWVESYDRQGKLWRLFENQYGVYRNVNDEEISFLVGSSDLDSRDMVATFTVSKPVRISALISPGTFTLRGIRRGAY
jgi:hypothetical protein